MNKFVKTAYLLFFMMAIQRCSENVNEIGLTISKETEVCLRSYEKYV
jgi:hypothetical protein